METLFIYLIKASGLIGLFYLAYLLLLRKETFFNSNRWFLLAGLITSVVLPLVVFTKIIWVEPTPTTFDWSNIPMTTTTVENAAFEINWYLVFVLVYSIGILGFLIQFAFDLYSLYKVLKGKTIQQEVHFKFIDITENIAPFSFFNCIVYNSSLYSSDELQNILEHEKVHSQQKHSFDVVLSRLFCVFFWFNPLIWLYKKAIVQNLEFIADSGASMKISDKKAYQLTLLKITTQKNCVTITNHFYQSLIKKRIIMLNQNPSKKQNSWKYITIFPALVSFVFLFQIEVIAQERETQKAENETKSETVDLKSFQLEKDLKKLSKNKEIIINGEKSSQKELDKLNPDNIEKIDVATISSKKTILVTTQREKEKKDIIPKPYDVVYIDGEKINQSELENNFVFKNVKDVKIVEGKKNKTYYITTSNKTPENTTLAQLDDNKKIRSVLRQDLENNPLIILNGHKTTPGFKIEDIPTDQIESINVLKGTNATEKYGDAGKYGVIEITTKEKIGKNEFQPIQHKIVQGFKIDQEKKAGGWKVESKPITTTLKEDNAKNDWIVGYGYNGTGNAISRIIDNQKINYKKAIIVIDGKQSDYKRLEKLNPKEIESVLEADIKNASEEDKNKAIQLYGKKVLNGFIQVNTKTQENK